MKTMCCWRILLLSAAVLALWNHAEAVAPRRSLYRSRMLAKERARQAEAAMMLLGGTTTVAPSTATHFRPSSTRCCKIGEKTGRKRLSCNLSVHALTRKNNLVHKSKLKLHGPTEAGKIFGQELALRISKCASSKYAPNFQKCCRYRESFFKELDDCKVYRGLERRKCRKNVRRRFP